MIRVLDGRVARVVDTPCVLDISERRLSRAPEQAGLMRHQRIDLLLHLLDEDLDLGDGGKGGGGKREKGARESMCVLVAGWLAAYT